MLIVAESIGLVGLIDTGWRWISFLDIVAIILLVWIVVLVMKTAAEVWGVRKQLVQATLGDTNSRPHTNKNSASSDV